MKIPCEKCNGTGKIEKPISLTNLGKVDCDLCEGTGFLEEDPMLLILERLDKIVELLEKIGGRRK